MFEPVESKGMLRPSVSCNSVGGRQDHTLVLAIVVLALLFVVGVGVVMQIAYNRRVTRVRCRQTYSLRRKCVVSFLGNFNSLRSLTTSCCPIVARQNSKQCRLLGSHLVLTNLTLSL